LNGMAGGVWAASHLIPLLFGEDVHLEISREIERSPTLETSHQLQKHSMPISLENKLSSF
jgi:hypothetical protein